MSLCYILSSLPMLTLDRPMPIKPEAFLSSCASFLATKDVVAVKALLSGDERSAADHPFVKTWMEYEAIIINTIAKRRLAKRPQTTVYTPLPTNQCQVLLERRTEEAYDAHATNPLARENALNAVQWSAAESLRGSNPLALSNIFVYAIQLRLLAKHHAVQAEAGQIRLDRFMTLDSLNS